MYLFKAPLHTNLNNITKIIMEHNYAQYVISSLSVQRFSQHSETTCRLLLKLRAWWCEIHGPSVPTSRDRPDLLIKFPLQTNANAEANLLPQ